MLSLCTSLPGHWSMPCHAMPASQHSTVKENELPSELTYLPKRKENLSAPGQIK